MSNPWTFGWTQLLTIIGFAITIVIAIGGFRTFGRWKKEKIEEKRIDTAIEALAIMYESKFIFSHIRSGVAFPGEWDDLPRKPGELDDSWRARGSFFAVIQRIRAAKEFFERAWKMQVRCAAIFGPEAEETFLLLQRARREVEVSADMLTHDPEPTNRSDDNIRTWNKFRGDVWEHWPAANNQPDPVGKKLADFRSEIEKLCRPIVDREFKGPRYKGLMAKMGF